MKTKNQYRADIDALLDTPIAARPDAPTATSKAIASYMGKDKIVEPDSNDSTMKCKVCGMMIKPGKFHYPWGDKARGPKHKP